MSEMTQQNAANSEESAASAVELDNLAHKMQKMVDAFNIGQQIVSQPSSSDLSRHAEDLKAKLSKKLASYKEKAKTSKPNGRDNPAKMIPFEDDFETLRDF